jgi:nitroreductase
MDFMEIVSTRRSIRRYKPDPVPDEDIDFVLEAARLAPSWANTQCWHFIVVTDPQVKQQLGEAGWLKFAAKAPVIIAACADPAPPGAKGDIPNYLIDTSIAMEHLILAATERGLGTCWIGGFDEAAAKAALKVPDHIRVVACTPLGYPNEAPEARDRKPLPEIASYDTYGGRKR